MDKRGDKGAGQARTARLERPARLVALRCARLPVALHLHHHGRVLALLALELVDAKQEGLALMLLAPVPLVSRLALRRWLSCVRGGALARRFFLT